MENNRKGITAGLNKKPEENRSNNRIMSAPAPRMAAGDSADRHPASFEQTVFTESFNRILGTGGREPAFRPQPGRYNPLIAFDQEDQGQTQYFKDFLHVD